MASQAFVTFGPNAPIIFAWTSCPAKSAALLSVNFVTDEQAHEHFQLIADLVQQALLDSHDIKAHTHTQASGLIGIAFCINISIASMALPSTRGYSLVWCQNWLTLSPRGTFSIYGSKFSIRTNGSSWKGSSSIRTCCQLCRPISLGRAASPLTESGRTISKAWMSIGAGRTPIFNAPGSTMISVSSTCPMSSTGTTCNSPVCTGGFTV